MRFNEVVDKIINRISLSEPEAEEVMAEIMSGTLSTSQIAALITALRMKGETIEEISGFAKVMRAKAKPLLTKHRVLVDTCGTGGDQKNTFNISTTVAFILAGAGIPVAKHGNRSVSSKCGSADVLEELGVRVSLTPEEVGQCLDEVGIGFLFAPSFHEAMKYAAVPRKEIGIRTIFNILGPLTNPAGASAQVLGVYDGRITEMLGSVLIRLGVNRAFVVHGCDGLDEVTHTRETKVTEVRDGKMTTYYIQPEDAGVKRGKLEDILGGDPRTNAGIVRDVLAGKKSACRDIVLLNAALALQVGGVVDTFAAGVKKAAEVIDSGAALNKLEELIAFTRRIAA